MMMTRTSLHRFALAFFACLVVVSLWPREVFAADEFGNIVHHIEARYNVHRNYRFLMGFAGLAVKARHGSGVKDLKIALFENQHFLQSAPDSELDELVQAAGKSGWQPLVKSCSRHSSEHTYIYAKTEGKDLKLLIVNVDPAEAEVVQVKVDPSKLEEFVNDHGRHGSKRSGEMAFN
jgi:hypothetical protein